MKQQILSKMGNCNVVYLFCKGFSNRGWLQWSGKENLCKAEWSSISPQGQWLVFGKGQGAGAPTTVQTPCWKPWRTRGKLMQTEAQGGPQGGRQPGRRAGSTGEGGHPLFSAYKGKDESPKRRAWHLELLHFYTHTVPHSSINYWAQHETKPTALSKKRSQQKQTHRWPRYCS